MISSTLSSWQTFLTLFFIVEWIIRLVMIFIVPRNRHPSSAITWLLLILITPSLGTVLYIFFGNPKLPKVRRHAQIRADARVNKTLQSIEKSHPNTITTSHARAMKGVSELSKTLGGLPPFNGNSVSFITKYHLMIEEQAKAIDSAEKYVHIAYFILVLDDETEPIFAAMERAIKRGVVVRVMYDRFATKRYPNYSKTLKRLSSIGADWHAMLPYNIIPGKNFTRFDLRNHRKLMIIDGVTAYSGSSNIIKRDYHRKDGLLYEDMLMKLTGPVVWQCHTVFRADWCAETGETLSSFVDDAGVLPTQTGTSQVQVLPSGPSHADDNNLMIYTNLFHIAQRRISIVVPYFIPDESVLTAITSAAKRGVDVTIINSEIIDKTLTGHAQRSYYHELLAAGVKIYLRNKPIFLHNKQILIDDDIAVVGSSNLDARSFELSMEITFLIYDPEVVKQLELIEDDYLSYASRISQVSWQKRPLHLRMLDSISRLTALWQ
jgi:cardiolipin synthase